MGIAEDFGRLLAEAARQRHEAARQQRLADAFPGLAKARTLSVAELRALWDSIDDSGSMATSDPDIDGDTVHFVLNEKNDGDYCAV